MARPDAGRLLSVAESIADGTPVDWAAVEAGAAVDHRDVVRQLRVLAELSTLHRTLPDDAGAATAAAPRRSTDAPAIGRWGHLELTARIGGGSFGDVYRAWDPHLERDVALKLLRQREATDDPFASRIVAEGRLLASVRHPNVVSVYGVAEHEGRVGLWMELVDGPTLEEVLAAHGPFSAGEAAVIGVDLCRALAAVHRGGLVHRDVKTQNVVRERGGRIVLMDLGTGRRLDAPASGGSDRAGTPLSLAPELFAGAPASARSDLYSLGVLLYRLVTGEFPVRAATMQELEDAHRHGRVVRLRDARPDLPGSFVRVVDRAIARDPQDRYASAGELESDLLRVREGGGSPAGAGNRLVKITRPQLIAAAGVAVASIVSLFVAIRQRTVAPPASPPRIAAESIRSLAVLPLVNLSGEASEEYFADGMTDELIGALGRVTGLNVISRTSTMRFKNTKLSLPDIARALRVDAVLEGSVLMVRSGTTAEEGNRVRINARLIYAGSDTQIWDRTFETVVADVIALQSQVARAVAEGIHSTVAPNVDGIGRRQDPALFDLYLRARYEWNRRTREGFSRSIQMFQEALDRDSNYAPAHAGLADTYNLLAVYGWMGRTEAYRRAEAAARHALALDPSLAEAHAALALVYQDRFEWLSAEESFKEALARKPNYSSAHHWYADYLLKRGRLQDALSEIDQAVRLDPLSSAVAAERGVVLLMNRRYDEAIAQLRSALDVDSTLALSRLALAQAYALTGRYPEALLEVDGAAKTNGDEVIVLGDRGSIDALAGRRSAALRTARELERRYRRNEDGAPSAAALVYSALGDVDRAVGWLERGRRVGDPGVGYVLADPRFDRIRNSKKFESFVATLGLTQ